MPIYLIPTPLSENYSTIPEGTLEVARRLGEFFVENEKPARAFLKKIGSEIPQPDLMVHPLNEHTGKQELAAYRKLIASDREIGVLSEAGCPAVADPGSSVVLMAHEEGIRVIPLAGPNSMLMALMGSGLNGQSFAFHGYLPREKELRKKKIVRMESEARSKKQTQLFMEAPYRNDALLADIVRVCSPDTLLCIACNLSAPDEFIRTAPVAWWKNHIPSLGKKPVVFLIG